MRNDIVTSVDETMAFQRVQLSYPHIYVENVGDAFAVIFSCLQSGDIPLYITHKGQLHCLNGGINPDPVNVAKLLRVYKISVNLTSTESVHTEDIRNYLDLGIWW